MMKLTMTTFFPHLQPALGFNQGDKFFYFHAPEVSHFPHKCLTFPATRHGNLGHGASMFTQLY
ncbi:MAG: hypothetical protein IDH49_15310 [Gammaproteobacteria bacterium]|nr:hypothetical protein [Gammaproteobacteria bacterium]